MPLDDLDMLRGGKAAWNDWREADFWEAWENGSTTFWNSTGYLEPDLRGVNLPGADLQHFNFADILASLQEPKILV